jgi:hypothetical protein
MYKSHNYNKYKYYLLSERPDQKPEEDSSERKREVKFLLQLEVN